MSRDNGPTQGQAGKCPKRSNSIRKKECLRAASKAGKFSTSDAANTKDTGIDRKSCFLTRSLNIYFAPMGFRVQTELDNSKHYFFQMVTDIHERNRKYSQSSLFTDSTFTDSIFLNSPTGYNLFFTTKCAAGCKCKGKGSTIY